MGTYSAGDIDELITCSKTILEPPKREMRLVGADWRNDMKMVASHHEGEFPVFRRKSEDFPETSLLA